MKNLTQLQRGLENASGDPYEELSFSVHDWENIFETNFYEFDALKQKVIKTPSKMVWITSEAVFLLLFLRLQNIKF